MTPYREEVHEPQRETPPLEAEPSPRGGFREEALPHLDAVYRFALRLSGDENEAQDLTQETFFRAFRQWHQYTPGSKCRSWLFAICRNHFIRSGERASRRRELLQENVSSRPTRSREGPAGILPSHPPSPDRAIFGNRIDDRILESIDALPAAYREAVVLSDIEGLTYEEVAEVAGIPVGTVRSRLFRGRRILRDELADYARSTGFLPEPGDAGAMVRAS